VIINIPGKEHKSRVIFQNQLEKLDYKKVSRNTYISPHPLLVSANRIASELGIKQNCLMFESRRLLNQEKIINDIWKADEINESYKQFIAQAKKSFKSKNNLHWVFTAKQLELEFKSIYCEDPHLPTEFLPKDWAGEMAYQRYKTIAQSY
jgi:DNA-binding transcriptional regulator PaaX